MAFISCRHRLNTLVSLRLQLMKATVLTESSLYLIFSPGFSTTVMSRDVSQIGVTHFPSFYIFYHIQKMTMCSVAFFLLVQTYSCHINLKIMLMCH